MKNIKKIPYKVKFGKVKNEYRGNDESKLISPPIELLDNYYWMRDDNKNNSEILEHIENENKHTLNFMSKYNDTNTNIYNELKSYIKEDYDTFKYQKKQNSFYKYFTKYEKGKAYPIYYMINTLTNTEIVLIDVNELASNKKYCNVKSINVSENELMYSYCIDYDGSEKYKIEFFTFHETLYKKLDIKFPLIPYANYLWAGDDLIYYTLGDSKNRISELWIYDFNDNYHEQLFCINHDNKNNTDNNNDQFNIEIDKSSDNKYLFLTIGDYNSNLSFYINFEIDSKKLVLFNPFLKNINENNEDNENNNLQEFMIENTKYFIDHHEGIFYIKTNHNNCDNWKIMKYSIECQKLEDFIYYNKYITINHFQTLKNKFLYTTTINGFTFVNIINYENTIINIINHNDNKVMSVNEYNQLNFSLLSNDVVYNIDPGPNLYSSDNIIIIYETMTTQCKYIEYDLENMNSTILYTKEIPNYDESNYICKRVYAPFSNTNDNNNWPLGIPISIIYNKHKYIPETAPLYLYGYGSYGITIEPSFNYSILPLLDRGWVYAIAHVRGGSFLGTKWYEDGRLYKKLNSFNDFINSTEYLGNNGYCDKNNITIEGRSAGGLLVGTCLTQRPELYKNVIMGVPFVDVLNTMADSSIPLTVEEWTQWGNPNIQKDFDYIKQYCPYTNIKNNNYNNVFITAGLHDPRVQYWEPLKFITKLREYDTNNSNTNLKLIKIETSQGHFSGSSRYKYIEECAEKYTFIINN